MSRIRHESCAEYGILGVKADGFDLREDGGIGVAMVGSKPMFAGNWPYGERSFLTGPFSQEPSELVVLSLAIV